MIKIGSSFIEVNDLAELKYVLLRDVIPSNPANFAFGDPISDDPKEYEDITKIMFGPQPGVDLTMVEIGDYIHAISYDGGEAIFLVIDVDYSTNHFEVKFFEKKLGYKANLFQDYDFQFFRAVDDSPVVGFNDYLLYNQNPYQSFHIGIPNYATEYRDWSDVTEIKFGPGNDLSMIEVGYLIYLRYTSDDKQGRYIIRKVDTNNNTLEVVYLSDNGGQVQVLEQYDIFIRNEIAPERFTEINFPDDPIPGQKYVYNNVEHTWILIEQVVKPDRGFWFANRIERRPYMPIDYLSNRVMLGDPDVAKRNYHYKIYKHNDVGTIKVSNNNIIAFPYGNFLPVNTHELTLPGEYFIYGEDTIFEGSDADWEFVNDYLRRDVTSLTNFLKDCPNYTGEGGDQLPNWDMSHITLMDSVFENASSFNQDISGWNTPRAVTMENMFTGATLFDHDLSLWCVRQMVSRPTEFDIGSGFESQFDKQPIWGTCPHNQDGLNMIGNVEIVGPDAVVIEDNQVYTWDNDGNYRDDGYQIVTFEEEWRRDGKYQQNNDIYFGGPGRYVEISAKITSRYATDSPQTGTKSVYIDGTLNSLDIVGPSVATQYTEVEYYVNAVGTGAGRVQYTWTLDGSANELSVVDISGKNDNSIVKIYFLNPTSSSQLCVKPRTDQENIQACKTVVVNQIDTSLFAINGPNTITENSTNRYTLTIPPDFPLFRTFASQSSYNNIDHISDLAIDLRCTYSKNGSTFQLEWKIYTLASNIITLYKDIKVECVRRTVTLNASQLSKKHTVALGSSSGFSGAYDEKDNFKQVDWTDACCDKIFNVDVNLYGDMYDQNSGVGLFAGFAYPALRIMYGLKGKLTINVLSGKVITGGPGMPQVWNIYKTSSTNSYGNKFSDRPPKGACEPGSHGRDIPAAAGEPGIAVFGLSILDSVDPENQGVVINNSGTIRGGGGGGTMGGLGQNAATTNCSGSGKCTRGGLGGNGGWGAGGLSSFSHNSQWWANGNSVMNGESGFGSGGSNGKSGSGGRGGNGGGIAAGGSQGARGGSKSGNQSGWTGCDNGPYDNPYKARTGANGYGIESTDGVTINNSGSIQGGIERMVNAVKLERSQVIDYLQDEFHSGRMTREDCVNYLADHNPEIYQYLRHKFVLEESKLAVIDERTLRRNK